MGMACVTSRLSRKNPRGQVGDLQSRRYLQAMNLDDILQRYFATTDISALTPEALASGVERCQVDLGLEQDPGKRFALWALLHMLGGAPDLDVSFESEEHRNAARSFMELLEASEPD